MTTTKRLRTQLLVFSFLLIGVSVSYAQSDFQEGFLITAEGDTLLGQVDFRSNTKNYTSCRFRDVDGTIRQITPSEIRGFGYKDDKFFTSEIIEGKFVEVLVLGTVNLYRSEAGYYIQKDGQLTLLEKDPGFVSQSVQTEGYKLVSEDNKWKGLLSSALGDCLSPEEREKLARMRFQERGLTQIVTGYNLCKGGELVTFKDKKPWLAFSPGVLVAWTASGLTLTNIARGFRLRLSEDYNSSGDFVFGATVDITAPRVTELMAFHAELLYVSADYPDRVLVPSNNFAVGDDQFVGTYYNATIEIRQITVPLGAKYAMRMGDFNVHALAGLHFNFLLEKEIPFTEQAVQGTQEGPEEPGGSFSLSNAYFGLWGGIGAEKRFGDVNLGLQLRGFQARRINQESGFRIAYNRAEIALALRTF